MYRFAFVAALVLLATNLAIAQDPYSANARLRGCQISAEDAKSLSDASDIGICLGMVATLMKLSREGAIQDLYRFCAPPETTVGQEREWLPDTLR